MILDDLTHADRYRMLSPGIAKAFDYLRTFRPEEVASGKYELEGDRLIANVARYQTRLPEQAIWESHRKYIDVQFIASGAERVGYVPLEHAPEITLPYSAERDVIIYAPGEDTIAFRQGQFAIFFPEDIHAPNLAVGTPAEVCKVVLKVAVAW